MNYDELYAIREWAPCTNIIERIPIRPPRAGLSLFTNDLSITCVSAAANYLALGTDGGAVYWCDRESDKVQRLDAETVNACITCLSVVDSVDFMLSAGDSGGKVHIFQIQKKLPPDLQLAEPLLRSKPIERYAVRELHAGRITCCEWSRNGMKLYSGDQLGVVVLTEFDYQKHLIRSMEILSEAYEIVQLSVHRQHLLVSTLYRAVICEYAHTNGIWRLRQVGKKDRKQLEDCGGILMANSLICGRPGQRFWLSDLEGNVQKTLLFKDALEHGANWQIPLLNPNLQNSTSTTHANFRQLHAYDTQQSLLVTHDGRQLYVLNIERMCVEAWARGFRDIRDICVHGAEIFVLEGPRSLIRLAPLPEKPNRLSRIVFNPTMPPPLPALGVAAYDDFEEPSEFTEPEHNDRVDSVVGAEEDYELPPIEALQLEIPIELAVESPRAAHARRFAIFNKIPDLDSDAAILHAHNGSTSTLLANEPENVTQLQSQRSHLPQIEDGQTPSTFDGIVEIGHVAINEMQNVETGCDIVDETTTVTTTTTTTRTECQTSAFTTTTPTSALISLQNIYPQTHLEWQDNLVGKDGQCNLRAAADVEAAKLTSFAHGQPVDDYSTVYCSAISSDLYCSEETTVTIDSCSTRSTNTSPQRQFVHAQPILSPAENIGCDFDSFLPDFRRAGDPFAKKATPPSDAEESHTSGDWEFLNN